MYPREQIFPNVSICMVDNISFDILHSTVMVPDVDNKVLFPILSWRRDMFPERCRCGYSVNFVSAFWEERENKLLGNRSSKGIGCAITHIFPKLES